MMKYSIVLALILATSLNADINIKVEGDVVYSIDGKESKALTAKSGQEIKFISGNGVLKLSDDVLKQKFNLKAPNDTYVAAIEKKSGFFYLYNMASEEMEGSASKDIASIEPKLRSGS